MLDFSLAEIAVVGTIALVVLGPERLPSAARTAGRWIGKARRFGTQMQQELTSQLEAEELRKELSEHQRVLDEQMQETRHALAQVQRDAQQALTDITSSTTEASPSTETSPSIAPPRDRYEQDETSTVTPWSPTPNASVSQQYDAPRPVIAVSALHPSTLSPNATFSPKTTPSQTGCPLIPQSQHDHSLSKDDNDSATTRNADES